MYDNNKSSGSNINNHHFKRSFEALLIVKNVAVSFSVSDGQLILIFSLPIFIFLPVFATDQVFAWTYDTIWWLGH